MGANGSVLALSPLHGSIFFHGDTHCLLRTISTPLTYVKISRCHGIVIYYQILCMLRFVMLPAAAAALVWLTWLVSGVAATNPFNTLAFLL